MREPVYHPCDWCGAFIQLNIKQDQARRLSGQTVFFCNNSHSAHWRWAQPHVRVSVSAKAESKRVVEVVACGACGIPTLLTKSHKRRRKDGHAIFFCGKACSLKWKWENTDMKANQLALFGMEAGRRMMIKRAGNNNRTSGRPGFFYIARFPGYLKFGSTCALRRRILAFKRQHGVAAEMLVVAKVPDAGAYEAAMMERYREHWIRGERFRDFLRF